MIDRAKLETWARAELRRDLAVNLLLAIVYFPLTLFMIGLTWLLVLVFTVFVGPWIGLTGHILVASVALAAGLLALLWWQHRKFESTGGPVIDPIENDFSEGDGSLGPQVLNVLMGMSSVIVAALPLPVPLVDGGYVYDPNTGRGRVEGTSAPKMITMVLFIVPVVLQSFLTYAAKVRAISQVDIRDTATLFQLLLEYEHKIPFKELEQFRSLLADPPFAIANLGFFPGVMFLTARPTGIALTTDLRNELRNL